ncbi:MAG: cold-shock protein [Alphaproteobacteria bacterium]
MNVEHAHQEDMMDEQEFPPLEGSEQLRCIVKWFNPVKGFGFVIADQGNEDIFLHFSVLDATGYQYLSPGDEIDCMVGNGKKGKQVGQILEVYPANQDADQASHSMPPLQTVGPLETVAGEVKWFNIIRGFGFVNPEDGGRDIFVHASVLRRIGLQKIYPGQKVTMQVTNSDRGRQAWTLDLVS